MKELLEMSGYLNLHGYDHCIEFGAVYVSDNRKNKIVRLESLRAAVYFVRHG